MLAVADLAPDHVAAVSALRILPNSKETPTGFDAFVAPFHELHAGHLLLSAIGIRPAGSTCRACCCNSSIMPE
jgi:hypothetical protein